MDTASHPATGDLVFRDADASDADALLALIESAYRGDASRVGWTTEADLLEGPRIEAEGLLDVIDTPGSRLLVVERDGVLVACCQLQRRDDNAHFGMFAVRPTLQGAGLGKVIIAEAERIARESWGAREMQLTVISLRGDLIGWYERRGYRRTGRTTPFPYGDESVGIPRRDDLEFELLVKPLVP
jgi:ribosomal protein S18 acetylase RimI-like enzyme